MSIAEKVQPPIRRQGFPPSGDSHAKPIKLNKQFLIDEGWRIQPLTLSPYRWGKLAAALSEPNTVYICINKGQDKGDVPQEVIKRDEIVLGVIWYMGQIPLTWTQAGLMLAFCGHHLNDEFGNSCTKVVDWLLHEDPVFQADVVCATRGHYSPCFSFLSKSRYERILYRHAYVRAARTGRHKKGVPYKRAEGEAVDAP